MTQYYRLYQYIEYIDSHIIDRLRYVYQLYHIKQHFANKARMLLV